MKFAKFADSGGNPVFVNPLAVRYVKSSGDSNARIYFDGEQNVLIPLPVNVVSEDIEKASRAS